MKRTLAAQQLLGHEYTGDDAEEYRGSEFHGFGQYIADKIRKLRNQAVAGDEIQSDIFRGCIIYVTGYTNPPLNELKRLITMHGGIHSQFFEGKRTITHIISTGLSHSKKQQFAKFKVVRPEWITESIQKGRMLPWSDFATFHPKMSKAFNAFAKVPSEPALPPDSKGEQNELESDSINETVEVVHSYDMDQMQPGDCDSDGEEEPGKRIINCLDPNFIKRFYENSRLHHLSTWKADLKREFQQLALAQNRQNHNHNSQSGNSGEKVIMHIDYDSFFVSVALKSRPDLQGKPACVSNGGTRSADIASCNYEARSFGVRNGMWVASALEKCPDLICLGYDFAGYEVASKALYDCVVDLHPDFIYPVSVDEVLIDVTSLVHSSDKAERREKVLYLMNQLRSSIEQKSGITASIGAGPNVLLAKLSLRRAKPSGEYFCPEEEALDFTKDISIRDLPGVGYAIASKLHECLDIETVGQLRESNKAEVKKIVGPNLGAKLIDYSYGVDSTDITVIDAPASIGVEIAWAIRVKTDQEALQFISNLSEELYNRLKRLQEQTPLWPISGRHLTLKIYRRAPHAPIDPPKFMGCGECVISSKSRLLDRPVAHVRDISYALQTMYPGFGCPATDLRGVGISLKLSSPSELKEEVVKNTTITGRFQKTTRDEVLNEQVLPVSPSNEAHVPPAEPSTPHRRTRRETSTTPTSKRPSPKKQRSNAQSNLRNQDQIVRMFQSKVEQDILNELPTQIREEIKAERELILGPKGPKGPKGASVASSSRVSAIPPPVEPERRRPTADRYLPITFLGKCNSRDIRTLVKDWVLSTLYQGGPHYDDICSFEKFVIACAEEDRDWAKIVRIIEWLNVFAQGQGDKDWIFLASMFGKVARDHLAKRGVNVDIS